MPSERTKVIYGEENITKVLSEVILNCKHSYYVYVDKNGPFFSVKVPIYNECFKKLKSNGVKIKFLTDITENNLKYCKQILENFNVEMRHLDMAKGNFAIADDKIYIASDTVEEKKLITELIYSNVKSIIEQNQYIFEALWKRAKPAEQRIREIKEGVLLPIETKVLDTPKEIHTEIMNFIERANSRISVCSPVGGIELVYKTESFLLGYKNIVAKHKEGNAAEGRKEGVRWLTHIEDNKEGQQYVVELIRKFLDIGVKIRHIDNLLPLHFAVNDRQFHGTMDEMTRGKMIERLLCSTEPLYITHFQHIFEELWKTGIDAKERINQIKKGISSEITKVIYNPLQAKRLFVSMIENAKNEILILFPTFDAVKRQNEIGIVHLLEQKSHEKVKVRVLSPRDNDVNKQILLFQDNDKEEGQDSSNNNSFIIREFAKQPRQQDIKSTILMVDKKHLLTVELKDDSKDTFEESIGFSTYSTSKPTILSYVSNF